MARRAHALTVEQLRQPPDPVQLAAAWAEGQTLTLGEAMALAAGGFPA